MPKSRKIEKGSALLVVDVQNDFCPGGALAVPHGDEVIAPFNKMIIHANNNNLLVVASRDWHPRKTSHFKDFGGIWPIHCVHNTNGAKFHSALDTLGIDARISKGMKNGENAYSAFDGILDEDWALKNESLKQFLESAEIKTLYIGGLATDYCVKATVLDALKLGFKVYLLEDACRAVNLKPTDGADAIKEMKAAGKKAGRGRFKIVTTKEALGR